MTPGVNSIEFMTLAIERHLLYDFAFGLLTQVADVRRGQLRCRNFLLLSRTLSGMEFTRLGPLR
jgi:hypothetical protein